jgi:hypothetical protein
MIEGDKGIYIVYLREMRHVFVNRIKMISNTVQRKIFLSEVMICRVTQ